MERSPTPLDVGAAQALVALATGAWRQAVLAVAARLDLCAMLGAREADLEEVCYSLGTRRHPMRFFLAACEGLGLVVARDDAFRLAPLGQALRDAGGGGPAAWARATGDLALADALEAALVEPLLSELPAGAHRPKNGAGMPTADDWEALHTAAAARLAAALPLPTEGLALEIGGRGSFLRACLERAAGLTGALVVAGAPGDDPAGEAWGAEVAAGGAPRPASAGAGAASVSDPFVQVPALEALGARRARLALVVHAVDAGGAAVLRARLAAVRVYLAPDARVVVVGGFLPPTPGRPLAPLLGLAALASGRAAWCPPAEAVAEHLRASGYELTETLVLPEPDVALLARA